jgi:protein PhnA
MAKRSRNRLAGGAVADGAAQAAAFGGLFIHQEPLALALEELNLAFWALGCFAQMESVFPRFPLPDHAAITHGLFKEPKQMGDDDYIYDEVSGEWLPAGELAARQSAESVVQVRDAVGNLLADGDQVTLIKDLEVKGAGQTLKRGTLIKSIRLTGDPQEIDCKYEGIKGLVLRAEFVRKR